MKDELHAKKKLRKEEIEVIEEEITLQKEKWESKTLKIKARRDQANSVQ